MTGETVTAQVSAWLSANDFVGVATPHEASHRPYWITPTIPYWLAMEGYHGAMLVRGLQADRALAVAEAVVSFRQSYPEASVVEVTDPGVLSDEAQRIFHASSATPQAPAPHRPHRLVVVECYDRPGMFDQTGPTLDIAGLTALGYRQGIAVVVSMPSTPTASDSMVAWEYAQTVWALGELTWETADGLPLAALEAGVRSGASTLEGFRAVMDGAPGEWVQAFESSTR